MASTSAGSNPCARRLVRIASRVAVAASPVWAFLGRLAARLVSRSASRRLARLSVCSPSGRSPSCAARMVVIGGHSWVAAAPVVPRAPGRCRSADDAQSPAGNGRDAGIRHTRLRDDGVAFGAAGVIEGGRGGAPETVEQAGDAGVDAAGRGEGDGAAVAIEDREDVGAIGNASLPAHAGGGGEAAASVPRQGGGGGGWAGVVRGGRQGHRGQWA